MSNAQHSGTGEHNSIGLPATQRVPRSAALRWLRRGASDVASAPLLSIGYGALFAVLGLAVGYAIMSQPKFTLTYVTAFILVGPFLATGLYKTAQLNDEGRRLSVGRSLAPLRTRVGHLSVYVLIMLLVTVAWIRMTTIVVALSFGPAAPVEDMLIGPFPGADGLQLQGVLLASTVLYAFVVYALSALSLPMIVDGRAGAVPAMIASLKAVLDQPKTMLLWALLVAAMTTVGVATFFVGLVVIFPMLGYAAWHSYQDLVA